MNKNGAVIYHGPSAIDGGPIVVIATGLTVGSANSKTGAMIQTHIMRADVDPLTALRTGADVSVCGGCMHRPQGPNGTQRSCYVNVARAQLTVWRAWKRGVYRVPDATEFPALFAGKLVRLGSYGDPAAVPLAIWDAVLDRAAGHTGYTHQWRSARLSAVTKYCQLSFDSCEDRVLADRKGLSTVGSFRVLAPGEVAEVGEFICPASAEAGHRTTCSACRACTGAGGGHVVIMAHGAGKKYIRALPVLAIAP